MYSTSEPITCVKSLHEQRGKERRQTRKERKNPQNNVMIKTGSVSKSEAVSARIFAAAKALMMHSRSWVCYPRDSGSGRYSELLEALLPASMSGFRSFRGPSVGSFEEASIAG